MTVKKIQVFPEVPEVATRQRGTVHELQDSWDRKRNRASAAPPDSAGLKIVMFLHAYVFRGRRSNRRRGIRRRGWGSTFVVSSVIG